MQPRCAKIENGIVTWIIICDDVEWARITNGGHWEMVPDDVACDSGWTWDGEKFIPPETIEGETK